MVQNSNHTQFAIHNISTRNHPQMTSAFKGRGEEKEWMSNDVVDDVVDALRESFQKKTNMLSEGFKVSRIGNVRNELTNFIIATDP